MRMCISYNRSQTVPICIESRFEVLNRILNILKVGLKTVFKVRNVNKKVKKPLDLCLKSRSTGILYVNMACVILA